LARTQETLAAQKQAVSTWLASHFTGDVLDAGVVGLARPRYSPTARHPSGVKDQMAERVACTLSPLYKPGSGAYHLFLHGPTAFRACPREEQQAARHIHGMGLPPEWLAQKERVKVRTIRERADRALERCALALWRDNGEPASEEEITS
jgi:hypothetical protein